MFGKKSIWIVFLSTLSLQAAFLDDMVERLQTYGASHMHHKHYRHRHYHKDHRVSHEVKWQLALQYLGYYHGKINGDLLTPESYQAVETFQHTYQGLASGFLDERFKPYLSDIYVQLDMQKNISYEGINKQKNVKKLQSALQIMGFYDGKIDGLMGEKSKNAIKQYVQSEEGSNSSDIHLDSNAKARLYQNAMTAVEKKLNEMKQKSYFPAHYQAEETEDAMTIDP